MDKTCLILPFPISEKSLKIGAAEILSLGEKQYRIFIPPETKFGQKVRLRGLMRHLHHRCSGDDLYLLMTKESYNLYATKRDIVVELPVKVSNMRRSFTKRINMYDDRYDVKIPNTIKGGQFLRMRNIASRYNGGYPGDILLKIVEKGGIIGNLKGFFSSFSPTPDQFRFKIKFNIPFLFEVEGEFLFETSKADIMGRYKH